MTIEELINEIEEYGCRCNSVNFAKNYPYTYICKIHSMCNALKKETDSIFDEIKDVKTEIKAVMDFIKNKDNTE